MNAARQKSQALYDLALIAASVAVAAVIVKTNLVHQALEFSGDGVILTSFVAGLFFTSLFTTAPAIVVLGELALEGNLLLVAVVGGLGAVVGDYLLYAFVRDRISADASFLLRGPRFKRFWHIINRSHFRRVMPIVGALIIASPFPDELGLALLGVSSISTRSFFILSFSMNALGILLIGIAARSIAF